LLDYNYIVVPLSSGFVSAYLHVKGVQKCFTRGFFQLLRTMQLSHKHSLEIIIVIVTSIWEGHMREWKIFLVENICRKAENSHENGDDEKRGKKTKMPCN